MTAKPVNVWFPTYVGDLFATTATFTGHEVGAYILIIGAIWRNGGKIVKNDKELAILAKATPKQWTEIWASIEGEFKSDGKMLWHPQMCVEIEKAKELSEKKRLAGIASGKSRRGTPVQHPLNENGVSVEPRAGSGEGEGSLTSVLVTGITTQATSDYPFRVVEGGGK